MEWHDGTERRRFEREQAELRKQYLAAGMTEEQIQALYAYDCKWYRGRRREALHTQRLDIQTSEDEDINKDNPLYKKFIEKLAVEDSHADYSRYGWVEEIENERLAKAVLALSDIDKELITMLMDGFNQEAMPSIQSAEKVSMYSGEQREQTSARSPKTGIWNTTKTGTSSR